MATVTIQSYLVQPAAGRLEAVLAALRATAGCEVLPAENRPVLVLVTETADRDTQRALEERLATMADIAHLALVSGWTGGEPIEEDNQ